MNKWIALFVVCATSFQRSTGMFISWKDRVNATDNDIFIEMGKLSLGKVRDKMFKNISRLSLDDRCRTGMPLSISWSHNEPYTALKPSIHKRKIGLVVRGIFPDVLKRMVRYCCNKSEITYGFILKSVRHADHYLGKNSPYDFTFPMYVSKRSKHLYKGQPFIPIVTAPKVLLLVDDTYVDGTRKLTITILSAWPFLMFMLGAASVAGLIIWFLEHLIKSGQFASNPMKGVWEGFWWAVVTMTTVGYGDRSPNSMFGRIFCFLWIICGINIIAIFTAIVTASVTASTQSHFNILGAKIGAVNGSEEFRLGVSLNLDMKAFSIPAKMTSQLIKNKVDGILIDNYALTPFPSIMKDNAIRLEKTYSHPITYGIVLSERSEKMEQCARQYMQYYRHEIFDRVSKYLVPLKNKEDKKSYAERASEGLFYQEQTFTKLMRNGGIVVASLVFVGLIWEFTYHRKLFGNRTVRRKKNDQPKRTEPAKLSNKMTEDSKKELVVDFQRFHGTWVERLSNLSQRKAKAKP